MNRKKRFILILITSLFCLVSYAKVPNRAEIVILSTTDIHGSFTYLAKFSAFIKQAKTEHKHVIVVDGGDRFTGNPYNDLYEKRQYPITDLLNHVGYDVMLVGNHEFDFGIKLLNERIEETEATVIMANIDFESSGLKNVKPYHVIEKNGIKIAFLGLSNVDKQTGKPAILAQRVTGIDFYDPIETALEYKYLREKSHVFVAMSHIGVLDDHLLADAMPELDLIIGGHSHTMLDEPIIQNGVMITQTGQGARYIGKTTIFLENGVVSKITNENIDLTTWDAPIDTAIAEKIRQYEGDLSWERPFVSLQHEIPNVEQLSYMVTDAALRLPGVDFALINLPGIRANNLPSGPVTYGDILRLSPFNNYLVVVGLKPATIRELIQQRRDFLSPAGFEYIALTAPNGFTKVQRMMLPNGERLDEDKIYYLAIDNFLFSRYLSIHFESAENTGVFVVDNIVDYLKSNPNMDYRNRPARARRCKVLGL
jgi:2',3'-cyclic-nucleotide 2'-phosphodiesterase (5'-nucleotidase family)